VLAAVFPLCWDIWEIDNQKISLEHENQWKKYACGNQKQTGLQLSRNTYLPERRKKRRLTKQAILYTLSALCNSRHARHAHELWQRPYSMKIKNIFSSIENFSILMILRQPE
jgi:hypothetical protein